MSNRTVCYNCGCELDEVCYGSDGQVYCEDCFNANFIECYGCGCVVANEDAKEGTGTRPHRYCESCWEERFFECHNCGHIYTRTREVVADCDSESYCDDCYNEIFDRCANCDSEICNDDACASDNGDRYCSDCYSDLFTHCEDCGNEIDRDHAVWRNDCAYCEDCAPESEWEYKRFRGCDSFSDVGSSRKWGVEIETASCPNYEELIDDTIFGCKEDGSIRGQEFVSPPMYGNDGLRELKHFCDLAARKRFTVDSKCGLHIHLDVSGENAGNLKKIARAYQRSHILWKCFVPDSRRSNNYCGAISWSFDDLRPLTTTSEIESFADDQDRYCWFNINAYYRHGTFEIRLHSGTVEYVKIANWIKAHTRFMDWATSVSLEEIDAYFSPMKTSQKMFDKLVEILDDNELANYLSVRAHKFGVMLTLENAVSVETGTTEGGE